MAASTKVQLGARVSPEVREAAVARAKEMGQSLNVWVERALGAALAAVDERIEPASRDGRERADLIPPAPRRASGESLAMQRQRNLNKSKGM